MGEEKSLQHRVKLSMQKKKPKREEVQEDREIINWLTKFRSQRDRSTVRKRTIISVKWRNRNNMTTEVERALETCRLSNT